MLVMVRGVGAHMKKSRFKLKNSINGDWPKVEEDDLWGFLITKKGFVAAVRELLYSLFSFRLPQGSPPPITSPNPSFFISNAM